MTFPFLQMIPQIIMLQMMIMRFKIGLNLINKIINKKALKILAFAPRIKD